MSRACPLHSDCVPRGRWRRGTILIVTLGVLIVLVGVVLVLARSMRVEAAASANATAAAQAAAIERGAEQYVLWLVDQQKEEVLSLTDDYFYGQQVGDGYFFLIRPDYGDPDLPLFGLVDESSKLNVNTATQEMLERMPTDSTELAPSILTWRGGDTKGTSGGADDQYYSSLPRPYTLKNAPLETVEELLLLRGCTREVLYGVAAVQRPATVGNSGSGAGLSGFGTGARGSGSALGGGLSGSSGGTGSLGGMGAGSGTGLGFSGDWALQKGLYDYVTVYSAEPATSTSGQKPININTDRNGLASLLRQTLGEKRYGELSAGSGFRPPFTDIFDFYQKSRMTAEEFAQIADRITTGDGKPRKGLININTAPREVLMCLPGLEEADVTTLTSQRMSSSGDNSSIAWVADALGKKAVGLGNLITTHSYQYSADIVAVNAKGRSFRRCRIVVDARSSPPVIVYRRDLTEEGWPLAPEILLSLRNGQGLPAMSEAMRGSTLR